MKNTKTVWLTHRLMQTFQLSNSAAGANTAEFIIRANSPYDPSWVTGGTVATGFDYYQAIYAKYRCTESTQQVKFVCTGQSGYASGVALIVHDLSHEKEINGTFTTAVAGPLGTTGGAILSTLKPGASHRLVSPGSGRPVTMFRRYNSRAAFGVTPTTGADEALCNANPTRDALYKVLVMNQGFDGTTPYGGAQAMMTGTIMITTRYKTKFLSPLDLTTAM